MMVIGVDPHKQSHTAVVVDAVGRRKGQVTVRARAQGHRELIGWGHRVAPGGRIWAIEDVRHVASGLVRELLGAGEAVVWVPPKLMAGARRGGRERGKSDPVDALAIARAAQREDLPAARLSGPVLAIRQLTDYRESLVAERTRLSSQLRWDIHLLDPGLAPPRRALATARACIRLAAGLAALPASTGQDIAQARLDRITTLNTAITAAHNTLTTLVTPLAPALLAIPGISILTAAKILGETGDARRFRHRAAYARHNGTAPIPASSGTHPATGPHRLSRGGNRQLNAAIHRTAITQARCHPGARTLLDRRATTTRETPRAALRVLKRHLSNTIYRALTTDAWRLDTPPTPHPLT